MDCNMTPERALEILRRKIAHVTRDYRPEDQALDVLMRFVRSAGSGLPIAQEPKYSVAGGAIINRASGNPIPANEPVFIFRARDVHAREALEAYASVLPPGEHRDAVCQRISDFANFSFQNPAQMREPDTAKAPVASPDRKG